MQVVAFFRKRPFILFILPAFIIYTIFAIYPMVSVIPYSVTQWGGIGPAKFVGLGNFAQIFGNAVTLAELKNAFFNTYFLLFLTYLILNPVVIAVAYFLYRKIFLSETYKTLIFMPQFVSTVAVSFIVTLFFAPNLGLYANFMSAIGLGQFSVPGIYANPAYGVPLLLLVGGWRGIGYETLLYVANFTVVPMELDEAARIDGANEIQRFFRIYFPLISPTFTNIVVLMYIWTLTTFDIPFLLGGLNGGANGCMDLIETFFYRHVFGRGMTSNFVGMGSAYSMIILIALILGSMLLQQFLSKREVTY